MRDDYIDTKLYAEHRIQANTYDEDQGWVRKAVRGFNIKTSIDYGELPVVNYEPDTSWKWYGDDPERLTLRERIFLGFSSLMYLLYLVAY